MMWLYPVTSYRLRRFVLLLKIMKEGSGAIVFCPSACVGSNQLVGSKI